MPLPARSTSAKVPRGALSASSHSHRTSRVSLRRDSRKAWWTSLSSTIRLRICGSTSNPTHPQEEKRPLTPSNTHHSNIREQAIATCRPPALLGRPRNQASPDPLPRAPKGKSRRKLTSGTCLRKTSSQRPTKSSE